MTTKYVALLRGVNVAGTNKVKMDELRRLFADLGHTEVGTYLQSGNVVFAAAPAGTGRGDDRTGLAASIEKAITQRMGLTVTVLLRTRAELEKVLAANPYLDRENDPAKLPVTFLAEAPDAGRAAALSVPAGETAVFTLVDQEVYLHCPDGYGRTKLNNAFLERKLGVAATTRNWKSVGALHELLGG
jgi:uncharacterized protein (DUF1697 family)